MGSDTPKKDGAYAPAMLQKMSLPPWMRSTRMASSRQPCHGIMGISFGVHSWVNSGCRALHAGAEDGAESATAKRGDLRLTELQGSHKVRV